MTRPSTVNTFGVGVQGEEIVVMFPQTWLSKEDAMNLAAWLVALSVVTGEEDQQWKALLNEVRNS